MLIFSSELCFLLSQDFSFRQLRQIRMFHSSQSLSTCYLSLISMASLLLVALQVRQIIWCKKKLFGGCINALNRHETLETIATLDTLFSWSLDVVLPQIGCRMTSAHAELGCGKDATSFVMVKSGRVHICIEL